LSRSLCSIQDWVCSWSSPHGADSLWRLAFTPPLLNCMFSYLPTGAAPSPVPNLIQSSLRPPLCRPETIPRCLLSVPSRRLILYCRLTLSNPNSFRTSPTSLLPPHLAILEYECVFTFSILCSRAAHTVLIERAFFPPSFFP